MPRDPNHKDTKESSWTGDRRMLLTPIRLWPPVLYCFHSPPSRLSGEGVGPELAIARTIIEAHRGAIWVEDNPGDGTVFQILLAAGSGVVRREVPITAPI